MLSATASATDWQFVHLLYYYYYLKTVNCCFTHLKKDKAFDTRKKEKIFFLKKKCWWFYTHRGTENKMGEKGGGQENSLRKESTRPKMAVLGPLSLSPLLLPSPFLFTVFFLKPIVLRKETFLSFKRQTQRLARHATSSCVFWFWSFWRPTRHKSRNSYCCFLGDLFLPTSFPLFLAVSTDMLTLSVLQSAAASAQMTHFTLNFTLCFPKLLQFCKVFVQDEDFGKADGRHFASAGSFLFFFVVVTGNVLPTNVDRTSRRCTQFGFSNCQLCVSHDDSLFPALFFIICLAQGFKRLKSHDTWTVKLKKQQQQFTTRWEDDGYDSLFSSLTPCFCTHTKKRRANKLLCFVVHLTEQTIRPNTAEATDWLAEKQQVFFFSSSPHINGCLPSSTFRELPVSWCVCMYVCIPVPRVLFYFFFFFFAFWLFKEVRALEARGGELLSSLIRKKVSRFKIKSSPKNTARPLAPPNEL